MAAPDSAHRPACRRPRIAAPQAPRLPPVRGGNSSFMGRGFSNFGVYGDNVGILLAGFRFGAHDVEDFGARLCVWQAISPTGERVSGPWLAAGWWIFGCGSARALRRSSTSSGPT